MIPYYEDVSLRLHHGDCLAVLRELPDASVDAVVTDPPYGLGFMGKQWDALPPGVEWAAECLRVLKPGGHMLAFGGSRTWHRLAVAVEDAGFELRDSIAWLYGSGFPKSLDVSKAIDKAERRRYVLAAVELGLSVPGNSLHDWTIGEHSPGDAWWERFKQHLSPEDWQRIEQVVVGHHRRTAGWFSRRDGHDITEAATAAAKQWQGWGTALKPAFEPIIVARKPLAGTVATNVQQHGTGALNIDACRVPLDSGASPDARQRQSSATSGMAGLGDSGFAADHEQPTYNTAGRWPANVVLDESQAAELDQQTGILTSGKLDRSKITAVNGDGWRFNGGRTGTYEQDSGGASRFFYVAKAPSSQRPKGEDGTAHPTVKPLDLMRWLVRLVTPPGGVVLEPFAGSGTTVEACLLEGFRCIAVEREAAYLPLILQRIARAQPPQDGLFEAAG